MNKKIFILALDGVPYNLLNRLMQDGILPNFTTLINENNFRQMESVFPTVSSVAWTSFMTGKNPAGHNIYGFIERNPDTMEVYVPTSINIKSRTIWEYLSQKDKKIFTMNVPVTYPPKQINGIMISGFLCTDIRKGTHPENIAIQLQNAGYKIDVDTVKARNDLYGFMDELNYTYEKRVETLIRYYRQDNWDFFMTHIMATDRLHHFLWEFFEKGDPYWVDRFLEIYKKIDNLIGMILNEIPANCEFMMLSDHGFTTLKKEVFVNKWLYDQKYLKFTSSNPPDSLNDIHPQSLAYSLIPGRIYINLKGREKIGSVSPGMEYERLREELREKFLEIIDEDSGEKIVKEVLTREQAYSPENGLNYNQFIEKSLKSQSPFYMAPDLILVNNDGYDFKGNLWMDKLTIKGPIVGTHTYNDAFLYIRNRSLKENTFSIIDIMPTILELMDVELPKDLHGKSVLN